MFFIFDRKKISSYLISIGTVVTLFAFAMINQGTNTNQTLQTGVYPENTQNSFNTSNSINFTINEENINTTK